jgi:hypothetical protein
MIHQLATANQDISITAQPIALYAHHLVKHVSQYQSTASLASLLTEICQIVLAVLVIFSTLPLTFAILANTIAQVALQIPVIV